MKITVIIVITFVVGVGVGSVGMRKYLGREVLKSVYIDAADNAKRYLSILQAECSDRATDYLEHFLIGSRTILESCRLDLCAEDDIGIVSSALDEIKSYKFQQVSP